PPAGEAHGGLAPSPPPIPQHPPPPSPAARPAAGNGEAPARRRPGAAPAETPQASVAVSGAPPSTCCSRSLHAGHADTEAAPPLERVAPHRGQVRMVQWLLKWSRRSGRSAGPSLIRMDVQGTLAV
ncbi:MAG TPA: hypothetical protein PJ982_03940, partial [Lacipirellulaceae bacterium]|nr:hypothetical protein [Lacipirellulaceae bacterium]